MYAPFAFSTARWTTWVVDFGDLYRYNVSRDLKCE